MGLLGVGRREIEGRGRAARMRGHAEIRYSASDQKIGSIAPSSTSDDHVRPQEPLGIRLSGEVEIRYHQRQFGVRA